MGLLDKFFNSDSKKPISALERKKQSENILRKNNIPYIEHLPFIEEESEVKIRQANEIAKRILILTYLCYVGEVPKAKQEVIDFLKSENLWESVSVEEQRLFNETMGDQDKANVSWRSESIWLLLWSINKIDKLDLPYQSIKVQDVVKFLPPFMTSTKEFINSATIRKTSELLDAADLLYRLHWATRQSQLTKTNTTKLDPSVVYERHYAINWITFYADNWDDVTTDT